MLEQKGWQTMRKRVCWFNPNHDLGNHQFWKIKLNSYCSSYFISNILSKINEHKELLIALKTENLFLCTKSFIIIVRQIYRLIKTQLKGTKWLNFLHAHINEIGCKKRLNIFEVQIQIRIRFLQWIHSILFTYTFLILS